MKFKVFSTKSIELAKIKDTLMKAKNVLHPLTVEFSEVFTIHEKDNDKKIYRNDIAATIKKVRFIKAVKYEFLNSLPHEGYDGVILFLNKDKALETDALYGQHTRLGTTSLIQCYISDRYVRLRKDNSGYVEEYVKSPEHAFSEGDPHALEHELMHALSWHYNLDDKLHDYIRQGKFDEYKTYLLPKAPLQSPDDLLPLVKRKVAELLTKLPIRVTEGFRSLQRQNDLYAIGRTKPGVRVTNARAGESMHNYGVAFDVAFKGLTPYPPLTDPQWQTLFDEAEKLGFQCYGRLLKWDYGHIQLLLDYTEDDFKKGKVDYTKFQ